MTLKFHQVLSMSSVASTNVPDSELNGVKLDEMLVSGVNITTDSAAPWFRKTDAHKTKYSLHVRDFLTAKLAHSSTRLVSMCLTLCLTHKWLMGSHSSPSHLASIPLMTGREAACVKPAVTMCTCTCDCVSTTVCNQSSGSFRGQWGVARGQRSPGQVQLLM